MGVKHSVTHGCSPSFAGGVAASPPPASAAGGGPQPGLAWHVWMQLVSIGFEPNELLRRLLPPIIIIIGNMNEYDESPFEMHNNTP